MFDVRVGNAQGHAGYRRRWEWTDSGCQPTDQLAHFFVSRGTRSASKSRARICDGVGNGCRL
jgi:hypothetical protein